MNIIILELPMVKYYQKLTGSIVVVEFTVPSGAGQVVFHCVTVTGVLLQHSNREFAEAGVA